MDRRKALTLSAAGAMLLASGAVAASGSWLQAPEPTAAAPTTTTTWTAGSPVTTPAAVPLDPQIVTEVRDVYDTVVVPTTANAPTAAPQAAAAPPPTTEAPTPVTVGDPPPATTTPTTAAPRYAASPTTTTTAPPQSYEDAELPEHWPADKPIPPMPEGCQEPHLEDDGVWNCEH